MRNPSLFRTEQHRFEDKLTNAVTALQEAMKIIGLGIDYRRYTKFSLLTPAIIMFSDKNYCAQMHRQSWPLSPEACRFCFDFVVETAFRLHDFDMDLT